MKQYTLLHGDCLDRLKELPDNSVDSIVTDPPYGLSFMGKKWDYDVPSEDIWRECLRVLKPGGHLLAFAGTRTQHRMAVRIEDAGFEIRDMIAWIYGQGFPKSLDISKAIDKAAGAEREVIGRKGLNSYKSKNNGNSRGAGLREEFDRVDELTAPATEEARQWQGWGTALKPALEPITVARKPLGEKTVAENVLKHGTGGINVDECRIATDEKLSIGSNNHEGKAVNFGMKDNKEAQEQNPLGRFPANLIHDGSEEVLAEFPDSSSKGGNSGGAQGTREKVGNFGYNAVPIVRQNDSESAARFFFQAEYNNRDLVFCSAKSIFASCQDQSQSQSIVSNAGSSLSLRNALESIAQSGVLIWPSLAGIVSSDVKEVSMSVTQSEYETLCETVIAAMSDIGCGFLRESQREKNTPCNSLVRCAAARNPIGIMTITASLLKSDGYAESATLSITPTNLELGEAASRFKYCAKASKRDRNEGLPDNGASTHPTVKPCSLMQYLCRLVTPANGTVLDPFMGSGSTGKAAMYEGFDFIGIEREQEYMEISRARIEFAANDNEPDEPIDNQLSLFE